MEENKVENLKKAIDIMIKQQVKYNLTKWAKEIGMDNILDLLKRNIDYPLTKFYIEELRSRGFKI